MISIKHLSNWSVLWEGHNYEHDYMGSEGRCDGIRAKLQEKELV